MEPKIVALSPSQAPSIHPSTSAFFGPGPGRIPDQALSVVWIEPVLLSTLLSKLYHEWHVVCITQKYPVRTHLTEGFMLHILRVFSVCYD